MQRLDGRAGHLGQLPRGQEGAGRHGVAWVVCRPAGDARGRPDGRGHGEGVDPAVAGEPRDSPTGHFGQLLCGEIQPARHRVVGVEPRPAAHAGRGPHGKRLRTSDHGRRRERARVLVAVPVHGALHELLEIAKATGAPLFDGCAAHVVLDHGLVELRPEEQRVHLELTVEGELRSLTTVLVKKLRGARAANLAVGRVGDCRHLRLIEN